MTPKVTLQRYVDEFRKWRTDNYSETEVLENQTDDVSFPDWINIQDFFTELLQFGPISNLDRDAKINLLYLTARGWDCGGLLYDSEKMPISSCGDLSEHDFIDLAKVALTVDGPEYRDAKWLIAYCFGKLSNLSLEIENILLTFYNEEDEYIKRMALFSLAKLSYPGLKVIIKKSWEIDDEWHKIGCLSVLDKYVADKNLLETYLREIEDDQRPDLREYVLALKNKNNC